MTAASLPFFTGAIGCALAAAGVIGLYLRRSR